VGGLLSRLFFRETPPPRKRPIKKAAPVDADEESWRQDIPKPPPLPRRRAQPPPVPRQRSAERAEPAPRSRAADVTPVIADVPIILVAEESKSHTPTAVQLAAMLKNRKMLKTAVLLHEILGPPLCKRKR
jgi:hypothetical protein